MPLSAAVLAVLLASGDEARRSVRGGVYEKSGCAEVGWPTRSRFEDYPDDDLRTKDFTCALGLYVDSPDITPKEKFDHLTAQARKGEKWNDALNSYIAKLDWTRYLDDVYRRADSLSRDEWLEVSGNTRTHRKTHPEMKEPPPRLERLFFAQALHNENLWVRLVMISWFDEPWATTEQALALALAIAQQLPQADEPGIRSDILKVQMTHDDPRTNKIVRDFLRGPLEFEVLKGLCKGYPVARAFFAEQNRHDFLPDLRALRDRLAAEKDVRKRFEAREAVKLLDELIPVLEKKKEANAPTCPARRVQQGADGGTASPR